MILLSLLRGEEGLGTFVGVVSLVGIVGPFANLGSGNLLVKTPPATLALPGLWARADGHLGHGLVADRGDLLASSLLLPKSVPFGLVLCVAVADLFFARLLELSSLAFMAFQLLRRTAQLQAMLSLSRLVAAAWLGLAGPAPRAATWSCCYLAASASSASPPCWSPAASGRPGSTAAGTPASWAMVSCSRSAIRRI